MAAVIVVIIDGIVGHQVVIVEEQTVETQTVGQLQVVHDIPVILQIEAQLVELYTCSRVRLAVVAVCQGNNLRNASVEEVVHRGITVVAGTITHIHVVGHLVLEADTGGEFVGTHVVGHVVLDVPNGIVNGIVPSEQLITQCNVVVAILQDIDEGEVSRVRGTLVVQLRIGGQELVREVIGETAVQVE